MPATASPKLLDQLRNKLRVLQYAWKTEKSYVAWVERFLRFHKERHGTWRHPAELGKAEIEQYLTFLAVDEHVAPSTQNQAFSAILFLYQKVLEIELPAIAAGRAKSSLGSPRLPCCVVGTWHVNSQVIL